MARTCTPVKVRASPPSQRWRSSSQAFLTRPRRTFEVISRPHTTAPASNAQATSPDARATYQGSEPETMSTTSVLAGAEGAPACGGHVRAVASEDAQDARGVRSEFEPASPVSAEERGEEVVDPADRRPVAHGVHLRP